MCKIARTIPYKLNFREDRHARLFHDPSFEKIGKNSAAIHSPSATNDWSTRPVSLGQICCERGQFSFSNSAKHD
jgi:hypothetical protein